MNKIIDACLANKGLKLLAIVLAIITWVYVSQQTYRTRGIDVPLSFTVPAEQFSILSQTYKQVRLTLQGPASAINQLDLLRGSVAIQIDVLQKLKDRMPSKYDEPQSAPVRISESDIRNLPPNITVLDLDPKEVTVTLDQVVEKRLTVKENLAGEVKEGLAIHKVYLIPKRVIVRGPRSILLDRDSIQTQPVDVSGLDEGIWEPERPLDTSDEETGLAKCLRPDPAKVKVQVEVVRKEARVTREIESVPIEIRGLPGLHYTLLNLTKTKPYTKIPKLKIEGTKETVEQPVRAFIDVTAITDPAQVPEQKMTVQFSTSPDVKVLTEPQEVMVLIKAEAPE